MNWLRTENGLSLVGRFAQWMVDNGRARWVGPFRRGALAAANRSANHPRGPRHYANHDDDGQFYFLDCGGFNYCQDRQIQRVTDTLTNESGILTGRTNGIGEFLVKWDKVDNTVALGFCRPERLSHGGSG